MKKHWGKILLIVLPVAAAAILLYPTWNSNKIEKLEVEAKSKAAKASNSEDSLAIMDSFYSQYGESLESAKRSRLKLGLDLRGGMYVTMEVDIIKLIIESAEAESIDDIFNRVIDKTIADQKNSDEAVIEIFQRNFDAIARPEGKTLLNYFETTDFRDISEEAILEKLTTNANQAIDQALEVIEQRINQYGVSEPNISKSGTRRIMLELPGVQNRNDMMSLLQTTARLEFNLVRSDENIVKAFARVDKYLSDLNKAKKGIAPAQDTGASDTTQKLDTATTQLASNDSTTVVDSNQQPAPDTGATNANDPYAGLSDEERSKRYMEDHPFTTLFSTFYYQGVGDNRQIVNFFYFNETPEGDYMFRISKDSIAKFNILLNRPDIKTFLPIDVSICLEAKPDQAILKQSNVEIFEFHVLKKEPELTGDVITDARATFNPTTNAPVVSMSMNSDGADSWARITGANLNKRIAVVLDNRVYTAPNVLSKITGGNSEISGMANSEEAHLLEIVLKAGALKAPVTIVEERIVGPSLGEDSINNGLMASIGAAILVVLFMLVYYNAAGGVADIAVLINVMLILAVLAALGGTLTLPGIAGIILTIGMAVDANVLIFERIREELAKGRSVRASVDEGFRKAMSAILDSNITTFLTGFVLYYFGSGSIQGFALTLMIGILGTLFTAIVITKAIIELIVGKTGSMNFGQSKLASNN